MKILAVAGSDDERAKISKLTSEPIKFVTAENAMDELEKEEYDFIISPPFRVMFHTKTLSETDLKKECAAAIYEVFSLRNGLLEERFLKTESKVKSAFSDTLKAENTLKEIYALTAARLFEENEWLELYISRDFFTGTRKQLEIQLTLLYREYTKLFPQSNDRTNEVIHYILNNPESDLRQKTIAQKLYINSSYLSTVFVLQTGIRYVDYITAVKQKRAAYLIMNTNLGIGEIADRLDYKDVGYFSRIFKSYYGMPPSQYRLPYNYTYEI